MALLVGGAFLWSDMRSPAPVLTPAPVVTPAPTVIVVTPSPRNVDLGVRSPRAEELGRALNDWLFKPSPQALAARGDWGVQSWGDEAVVAPEPNGRVAVAISLDSRVPAPDCTVGTIASAEGLAQWIGGQPELATTAAKPVSVAGVKGLQLDVVTSADATAPRCGGQDQGEFPVVLIHENSGMRHPWSVRREETMRVYFFNFFEDALAPAERRTVVVMIIAPMSSFERTVERAMPIMESFLSVVGRSGA